MSPDAQEMLTTRWSPGLEVWSRSPDLRSDPEISGPGSRITTLGTPFFGPFFQKGLLIHGISRNGAYLDTRRDGVLMGSVCKYMHTDCPSRAHGELHYHVMCSLSTRLAQNITECDVLSRPLQEPVQNMCQKGYEF